MPLIHSYSSSSFIYGDSSSTEYTYVDLLPGDEDDISYFTGVRLDDSDYSPSSSPTEWILYEEYDPQAEVERLMMSRKRAFGAATTEEDADAEGAEGTAKKICGFQDLSPLIHHIQNDETFLNSFFHYIDQELQRLEQLPASDVALSEYNVYFNVDRLLPAYCLRLSPFVVEFSFSICDSLVSFVKSPTPRLFLWADMELFIKAACDRASKVELV